MSRIRFGSFACPALTLVLVAAAALPAQYSADLVVDVNRRVASGTHTGSDPADMLFAGDGLLWFTAAKSGAGRELWSAELGATDRVTQHEVRAGPASSDPRHLREVFKTGIELGPPVRSRIYSYIAFSAEDDAGGREPWIANSAGSWRLKDIRPGRLGSFPEQFAPLGDRERFVFLVDGDLWVSDFTEAGTRAVSDNSPIAGHIVQVHAAPPSPDRSVVLLVRLPEKTEIWEASFEYGDIPSLTRKPHRLGYTAAVSFSNVRRPDGTDDVFFVADGELAGWVSEDSSVLGVNFGLQAGPVVGLGDGRHMLAVTADPVIGVEPIAFWRGSGWQRQTFDLYPAYPPHRLANSSSNPRDLLVAGSSVFFTARVRNLFFGIPFDEFTSIFRADLGGSSGSTPVVTEVGRISEGDGRLLGVHRDSVVAIVQLVPIYGGEPYLLGSGFQNILDINPGLPGSHPSNIVSNGTVFVFSADDGVHGRELWKSDGTLAGTKLIADLDTQGSSTMSAFGAKPEAVDLHGRALVFVADDGEHGSELWATDGTAGGTRLLADLQTGPQGSSPRSLTVVGNQVFFAVTQNGKHYLATTDGSASGTRTLTVANNIGGATGTEPRDLIALRDGLVFSAILSTGGPRRLYRAGWDGASVVLTPGATDVGSVCRHRQFVYFAATTPTAGTELWRTDGTPQGTVLVRDIVAGANGSLPRDLVSTTRGLFFSAQTPTWGRELWFSEGPLTGQVKDIISGAGSGNVKNLVALGDRVFFAAQDTVNTGDELWVSDGSAAGTIKIELAPGPQPSWPKNLFALNSRIVFEAMGGELWTSDGTAAGTRRVTAGSFAAYELTGQSYPTGFLRSGADDCWFGARGDGGRELWQIDDTASAARFADLNRGAASSEALPIAVFRGDTYVVANDGRHGAELFVIRDRESWKSIGQSSGPLSLTLRLDNSSGQTRFEVDAPAGSSIIIVIGLPTAYEQYYDWPLGRGLVYHRVSTQQYLPMLPQNGRYVAAVPAWLPRGLLLRAQATAAGPSLSQALEFRLR